MAARCFNDTCTITVTESANMFDLDVNLASGGSIICNEAQGGLKVYIQNDGETIIPTSDMLCHDLLTRMNTGQLIAPLPDTLHWSDTVTPLRSVPDSNTASQFSLGNGTGFEITNNQPCEATCLVIGQFQLNYNVKDTEDTESLYTGVGALVTGTQLNPFNAHFKETLLVNGVPKIVEYVHVGGALVENNQVQLQKDWRTFAFVIPMNSGQMITLTDTCEHDGFAQALNITADNATTVPNFTRGFRTIVEAWIFPNGMTNQP